MDEDKKTKRRPGRPKGARDSKPRMSMKKKRAIKEAQEIASSNARKFTQEELETLEGLSGYGVSNKAISIHLNIPSGSFQYHLKNNKAFRESYERGKAIMEATLKQQVHQDAIAGNKQMALTLLKTNYGYSEPQNIMIQGDGGNALSFLKDLDLSKLSEEELKLWKSSIRKLLGQ